MLFQLKSCPALLLLTAAVLTAQTEEIFQIPVNKLDRYQASTYTDQVESYEMERTRLIGKEDLIYEIIPDMIVDRDVTNASIAFSNRWAPLNRYELTRFPADAIDRDFGLELIQAYLNGRALELEEQGFEVTLAPEVTTGPARFRILGQRTISFTYAYIKDEQRILRGENWVEIDGIIYIVAIEAPESNFRRFFERARVAMNSMHHPD
ncbi:MAG: hypothetical protein ACLFS1_08950 [Opitutales bacterium]